MAWNKGPIPRGGEYDHAEKKKTALDMRKAGIPYREISAKLGYKDESGARKLVEAALRELPMESAEELRTIELERLDFATMGLMGRVKKGDPTAVQALIRLMDHRAKLTGLYNIQVDDGQSEAVDKLAQLIQAVQDAAKGEGLDDSD